MRLFEVTVSGRFRGAEVQRRVTVIALARPQARKRAIRASGLRRAHTVTCIELERLPTRIFGARADEVIIEDLPS